jgi:hypothetical protein
MANVAISALPLRSTVVSTDILPMVYPGTGNGTTYKATFSAVANYVLSGTAANANVAQTVSNSVQSNITTIGNGAAGTTINLNAGNSRVNGNLIVTGNLTVPNLTLTSTINALHFVGEGGNLSNIQGGNVAGQVANAHNATFITNGSQPNLTTATNLTQIGTLANLTVSTFGTFGGNITAQNADLGNMVTANYFIGNGFTLTNVAGANVSGTVPLAALATAATTAGTVTTAAQPTITSVGTLSSLTVAGSSNLGGLVIGPITAVGNMTATITHTADITINSVGYKLMLTQ